MKRRWLGSLAVALGVMANGAPAEEFPWRPAGQPQVIASTPGRVPAATLGKPIALSSGNPPSAPATGGPTVRAASYPAPSGPIIRCQDAGPPPVPPPGVPLVPGVPDDRYNCGVVGGPPPADPLFGGRSGPVLGEFGMGGGKRNLFQSDHCFDMFASPVTNPFRFEDPRSLTEVRPIFIYQMMPTSNWITHGGNIEFFGMQARVALTDRWSIVMQKLGGIAIQPDDKTFFGDEVGFSELYIGPKWTFIRNEDTGTVAALGLTFEIPIGSSKVFQDTGDLTLRPYASIAQNFGRTCYGSFNAMGVLGYGFSTDNARSDYLFSSLHLDYDIGNAHKIYPLIELNWSHYTTNGTANAGLPVPLNFEGGDLANLGSSNVSGNDLITLAVGARYKFTECAQIGTAVEFPVSGRKDLNDFRWTVDFIWRY